ncbi:hypothetical protein Poli38472_001856 [Pythium oligandrum]|uniref:Mediator complex subunit 15 KIX domain-containing protein n=1 Tax=Pythium oligandrum TaxID=41045 RepID=A0A8K1CU77_PYTOL|nr:hypothetical protein Poli38472_001856 [Pythium oligandrum]|eukprot:TMW69700.1 hypothetical protein Poli38472_001856 [Pythium oligandrum]
MTQRWLQQRLQGPYQKQQLVQFQQRKTQQLRQRQFQEHQQLTLQHQQEATEPEQRHKQLRQLKQQHDNARQRLQQVQSAKQEQLKRKQQEFLLKKRNQFVSQGSLSSQAKTATITPGTATAAAPTTPASTSKAAYPRHECSLSDATNTQWRQEIPENVWADMIRDTCTELHRFSGENDRDKVWGSTAKYEFMLWANSDDRNMYMTRMQRKITTLKPKLGYSQ